MKQVVYLIGALIGIGACCYVWFGEGEFFHSYGVYVVASLYGKREDFSESIIYHPHSATPTIPYFCCMTI